MRHLLKLSDLSRDELFDLLYLADKLKSEKKAGLKRRYLDGKTLGMIFTKSSTRTRVSFEVGMYELGGSAIFLSSVNTQMGRGEPIEDTARVLSRYLDGIMIRTYEQKEVEALAKYGSIPIINGLTDYCHPCQVLADLMTIREYKGTTKDKKICYIGDGNNMANSLIVGGIKAGMEVAVACPKNHMPDKDTMDWASANGKFLCTENIKNAAKDADVLYTDVFASMGQESEAKERMSEFQSYQINEEVMSFAKDDAIVLHCLPAHRGEEITAEVLEKHADEIFEQAENRLHAQKAVLVTLMG